MIKYSFSIVIASMLFLACNETPYIQGKRLYEAKCQNCHMEDGSGLNGLIPPLNTSSMLDNLDMVCIIKSGLKDTIRQDSTFLPREMPAFNKLTASEIANIVNYVNFTWHTPFKEKTILEIENKLHSCE